MKLKTFNALLLFSLFGITMWFFGNLYEAIVIGPNMLEDPVLKMNLWKGFFTTTNPAIFYVPITPLAFIAILILYFKTATTEQKLKRHLKLASVFGLIATIVGIIIITQINFKLFFGNGERSANETHNLALWWNVLNGLRIVLVAPGVYHLFRAYVSSPTSRH